MHLSSIPHPAPVALRANLQIIHQDLRKISTGDVTLTEERKVALKHLLVTYQYQLDPFGELDFTRRLPPPTIVVSYQNLSMLLSDGVIDEVCGVAICEERASKQDLMVARA